MDMIEFWMLSDNFMLNKHTVVGVVHLAAAVRKHLVKALLLRN